MQILKFNKTFWGGTLRKRSCLAFTLAEVLITLGIIGIVAAIIIPLVISNYKKQIIVTKLKHAYSVFKNAESMAISEHGAVSTWDFDYETSTSVSQKFWETYFLPYLNYSPCKYSQRFLYPASGTDRVFNVYEYPTAYCLPDGTLFWGSNNGNNGFLIGKKIIFDINGNKGPNIFGKDIFELYISKPVKTGTGNYADWSYYITPKCPVGLNFCAWGTSHGNKGYYWETEEEVIYDCYNRGGYSGVNACGYMIEQAGWKIPKNYPVKL